MCTFQYWRYCFLHFCLLSYVNFRISWCCHSISSTCLSSSFASSSYFSNIGCFCTKKKPTHAFYGGLVHRSLKVNKGIHKEEGRGMKIKMSEHDHVCVQNKTIYPSQDTYIRHIMWSIKIEKWKLINVTPQTATK